MVAAESASCSAWTLEQTTASARPLRGRCGSPTGRLSCPRLVVAHQQFVGAAGDGGHVRAPLIEDQIEAGAQVVPPLLQRRDATVPAERVSMALASLVPNRYFWAFPPRP